MLEEFLGRKRTLAWKQLIVATAGAWFGGTVLTLVDVWAGAIAGALAGAAAIYLGFLYKPTVTEPRKEAVPPGETAKKAASVVREPPTREA